ncbi:Gfo/Idh/MocA family protein [Deinococcus ruber]|uniref:Oxidoreductase n=1 Tax=Deinococcus ruber TaxID=1848197 RepID=A0A918CDU0_9DEIO|nr:Gfo/Idh/MocA family oxidoreductase [Deinococcus ruber]GGR18583.1 oxidoreductase [Deinococcus ruber]
MTDSAQTAQLDRHSLPARVVVIGAGNRGDAYADYALLYPEELQIVGVAEQRAERRTQFAQRHALPPERTWSDWRDLLTLPRLADAVLICTLDHQHAESAVALAGLGYHILLEKPMAPTEAECQRIVAAAEAAGVMLAVCHVLRYTAYTRALKKLLTEGRLGRIVSIEHLEPVGWWHQAHSFVRGNWRNERESNPMLLSKSCHDLDWLSSLMDQPCTQISSFGSLFHFRASERPAGAADRCLDCPVAPECAYDAARFYLGQLEQGNTGWPLDVITADLTEAGVRAALRTGPYGRCVYVCDNDVVDHQVVSMQFQDGATASFTMTAFTRARGRETRIFGTRGELYGDSRSLRVFDFLTQETLEIDTEELSTEPASAHGGGDFGLVRAFVRALRTGDQRFILSGAQASLASHRLVFAAEAARREATVQRL